MFHLKKHKASFWAGFVWAYHGLKHTFKAEINFQIQIIIALLVFLLAAVLNITTSDWLIIIITAFIVLSAELFNTAIESLVDLHINKIHPAAKIAKDASAGAVLLLSIMAAIIGLVIFIPYL
ncbi:MAG: diacylglycerol kinase family protein [bacterium]|nr:diacylglycerol kinase family protein [bacterium]